MHRLIVVSLLVVSTAGFAQTEKKPERPKTQNMVFDGDLISGDREVPLGEIYGHSKRPVFKSLIKVRLNFNDKLAGSVHEM